MIHSRSYLLIAVLALAACTPMSNEGVAATPSTPSSVMVSLPPATSAVAVMSPAARQAALQAGIIANDLFTAGSRAGEDLVKLQVLDLATYQLRNRQAHDALLVVQAAVEVGSQQSIDSAIASFHKAVNAITSLAQGSPRP